ncbi:MAG: hypothetical protein MJ193_03285, partial [Clostridia bacterium]|nr:hypothetical protein [Clostridia bacterium]
MGKLVDYVNADNIYYMSLTIRGGLYFTGYHDYVSVGDYLDLLQADGEDVSGFYIGGIKANGIDWAAVKADTTKFPVDNRYFLEQGDYASVANAEQDFEYVLFSTGASEALSEVLGGIVGDLDTVMMRVLENFSGEVMFEIKINLAFELHFLGAVSFSLYDLDLAIDMWRRENDGNNGADGTLTHLLGLYYNHDTPTGIAGLMVDLEWLLGEGAKLAVDLSDYTIEELLSGLIDGSVALGASDSDAIAAASTEDGGLVEAAANPLFAGAYINIYTRSLAVSISKGFLGLLLDLLGVDLDQDILPNFKAKVKLNLEPYDIRVYADLFNAEGTKGIISLILDLELFNDSELASNIDFGTVEHFEALNLAYKESLDTDPAVAKEYIFYYANFTRDDETPYENAYVKVGNAIGGTKGSIEVADATAVGPYVQHTDYKYYVKADTIFTAAEFDTIKANGVWIYKHCPTEYYPVRIEELFNADDTTKWDVAVSGNLYKYVGANPPAYLTETTDCTEITDNANIVNDGATYYSAINDFTNYTPIMSLNLSDLLSGGSLDIGALLGDLKSAEVDLSLD